MSVIVSAPFSGFLIARLRPELVEWVRDAYLADPNVSFAKLGDLTSVWRVSPPAIPGASPTALQAAADQVDGLIAGIPAFAAVRRQRVQATISRESLLHAGPFHPIHSLLGYYRIDTRGMVSATSVNTLISQLASATLIFDSVIREPSLTPPSPRVNWEDDREVSGPDASWQLHTEGLVEGALPKQGIYCNSPQVWDSGYDGSGVGFVDIERGWYLDHPDLPVPQYPGGGVRAPFYNDSDAMMEYHGTSALGIVVGVDNTEGIVGIAPAATLLGVASFLKPGSGLSDPGDITNAILESLEVMAVGDVLLLEVQTTGGGAFPGADTNLPVEVVDLWFDAIRLAVGSGVVVIEPAGNGHLVGGSKVGWELDTVSSVGSNRPLDRDSWGTASAHLFDSGAIMVSACYADLRADGELDRLDDCNRGSRVDCYAWGEEVYTTTSDPAGYGVFGETSAASAIIAGAAILVQQMWRKKFGTSASCATIRALLSTIGTKVYGEAVVQPDLAAIATKLDASPDVFIRDDIDDEGTVPSAHTSQSPDIIVRSAPVANPQLSLGEGSGTENTHPSNDPVVADAPNYVYVRMRNRNPTDATNVVARVYWAEAGTLIVPVNWNFIGESAPLTVPGAPLGSSFGALTVANAIVWTPASGAVPPQMPAHHGCFIALLSCAADPPPPAIVANAGPGGSPTRWSDFLDFIGSSNNAAWRNFSSLDAASADGALLAAARFLVNGADRAQVFDFEVVKTLPKGVRAHFRVEPPLARQFAMARDRPGHTREPDDREGWFTMEHGDKFAVSGVTLPAKARYGCQLRLVIHPSVRPQRVRWALRQLFRGREVGRVTFEVGLEAWMRLARQ